MRTAILILCAAAVATSLLLSGCAELKEELPTPVLPGVRVHEEGFVDPDSPNFHGKAIRAAGWDMRQCRSCHGQRYDGGFVEVSCRTCHDRPAGPENCVTCHGSANPAPPRDLDGNTSRTARGVGAHQIHFLGGTISGPIACTECHIVPGAMYDPGHVDNAGRAEVQFLRPLANRPTNRPGAQFYSVSLPTFTPSPAYDYEVLTCANTYCHGYFKNGNLDVAPVWNDPSGPQAACGTCHGDPNHADPARRALPRTAAQGGTHPNNTACHLCHGDVVDVNRNIIDKVKHINGKLNVFGQEFEF